jgi:hypothetical protein
MFTTALFTIDKLWNQPKCPSMDEWIKKNMVCIYNRKMKKGSMSFAGK